MFIVPDVPPAVFPEPAPFVVVDVVPVVPIAATARNMNATDIALTMSNGSVLAVKPTDPRLDGLTIAPYDVPVVYPLLTPRQLRLGLLDVGISRAMVESAIAAIADPDDRERAEIEWQYAVSYERDDPLVVMLGGALGLTTAQIDAAWTSAATL